MTGTWLKPYEEKRSLAKGFLDSCVVFTKGGSASWQAVCLHVGKERGEDACALSRGVNRREPGPRCCFHRSG